MECPEVEDVLFVAVCRVRRMEGGGQGKLSCSLQGLGSTSTGGILAGLTTPWLFASSNRSGLVVGLNRTREARALCGFQHHKGENLFCFLFSDPIIVGLRPILI